MRFHLLAATAIFIATSAAHAAGFELKSPDVAEGKSLALQQVLKGFGCDGGNTSPELHWSNAPKGTKSFVLTVYDPDAPTGSGWWHWVVYNIPANVTDVEAGASDGAKLPQGAIEARTDFGTPGYGGACPPPGKPHRYIFRITALGIEKLELNKNASPALVGFMAHANTLGAATITAIYGR